MKHQLIFATIMAGLVFTSCTSSIDEEANVMGEVKTISFDTYVDQTSRALDKNAFAVGDVIGVSACYTDGDLNGDFTNNFMDNEALTKEGAGKWTYANAKFWPMNSEGRISFVAVYPKIQPSIANGECTFDFSVKSLAGSQEDFIWSTVTNAHSKDRNGTYQNGVLESPAHNELVNVLLHFRHALSRIVFKAKATAFYPNTTITISSIKVNNLYGSGSYTLTNTLSKGAWAMSGNQDKSYTVLENGTDNVIDTSYKNFGESLLMIPQLLPTTGTHPTVTISYVVKYGAPAITLEEERTFDLAVSSMLNGGEWEQDKVYTYNFNISLDMITFDADIDNWSGSETYPFSVE